MGGRKDIFFQHLAKKPFVDLNQFDGRDDNQKEVDISNRIPISEIPIAIGVSKTIIFSDLQHWTLNCLIAIGMTKIYQLVES